MSTIYLPVSVIEDVITDPGFLKKKPDVQKFFNDFDKGSPVEFKTIKQYSINYRRRTRNISKYIGGGSGPVSERVDLIKERIALAIDGVSIANIITNTQYKNLIALFGFFEGHVTVSLVGADPTNPERIATEYQNQQVKGYETWPAIGALGNQDSDNVLNSSN